MLKTKAKREEKLFVRWFLFVFVLFFGLTVVAGWATSDSVKNKKNQQKIAKNILEKYKLNQRSFNESSY